MSDTITEGKKLAVCSYLTILGALITMSINSEKKNTFASFHIRQAFGLCLTFFVLGFAITAFDNIGVTYGFWIFFFVLWLFGFLGALNGKYRSIPILGNLFQKTFKNIG
ncbi:MAG TPA: hypothetical protein VK623_09175 [Flavobacterium sp.]|nr:hypothetical protein [Flavobacterium sp.]